MLSPKGVLNIYYEVLQSKLMTFWFFSIDSHRLNTSFIALSCRSINNQYKCLIQESFIFGPDAPPIPHLFGFLFTRQICYWSSVMTSNLSADIYLICYTSTIIFYYYQYKDLLQLSIKPVKYKSNYRVIVTTAISIHKSWAFSQVRLVLIVSIFIL